MSELTTQQQTELTGLIQQGKSHYAGLANVVLTIYQKKLYTASGSIHALCEQEFGITKRRTYQLIDYAEVIEQVERECTIVHSTELKETHVRELANIPDDKTIEVLEAAKEKAVAEEKPLTAKIIKTTAAEFFETNSPVEPEPTEELPAVEPKQAGIPPSDPFKKEKAKTDALLGQCLRQIDDLADVAKSFEHDNALSGIKLAINAVKGAK